MSLKVYNTLTRAKEEFVPIQPGQVSMYVCGPTVYDDIHIGNARPAIFFDVVRRYLEQLGYDVRYIVNFTDVDDKLIRKSEQTGEPVPALAERYIRSYFEDIDALGVRRATVHPRVTEHIEDIVDFIGQLVEKGFAYESGGDVFFETAKYPEYGRLSHQNVQELQYGIRVEVDERKKHPQDFVLWKAAKPGEIFWQSPWGPGRPGWHIECSTMVRKYLGETIDIHGGGQDLQFPHHECESAQSACANGKPLAKYWMHNAYVNIDNEKMSKSLGNVVTVKQLLKRAKPQTIRFLMLSTHYRNPLKFNDEALEQAAHGLERFGNSLTNLRHRLNTAAEGPVDETVAETIERIRAVFRDKMNDDFNTPDAITAMFELAGETNQYLTRPSVTRASLEALESLFSEMDRVLGILPETEEPLLDEEIERLIRERTEARKAKNWAKADEIRDLLMRRGILLEDTPQGVRWRRK
jgi:cysteinyl-tRNA synthetase